MVIWLDRNNNEYYINFTAYHIQNADDIPEGFDHMEPHDELAEQVDSEMQRYLKPQAKEKAEA